MDWHLITCEYPPRVGGVADHTRLVAEGLAAEGDRVYVWCPAAEGESPEPAPASPSGASWARFRPSDLRRAGRALDRFAAPRRLLLQWVPHGYGYRSMNVWLCFWLCARARLCGDEVTHHRPRAVPRVRRGDAAAGRGGGRAPTDDEVLLSAARLVWTTIPKWEECWRPYTLGRRVPFGWLPVPSTTPVVATAEEAAATAPSTPPRMFRSSATSGLTADSSRGR